MKITGLPTKTQLAAVGRQLAAIAAVVTSLTGTLPPKLQSWGFGLGAVLLIGEHFVAALTDPTTSVNLTALSAKESPPK